MSPTLAHARTLLFEVPRTGKLAYCLMRDPRVPLGPKLAIGAALALTVSPVDVPGWVPVIGDLDVLALGVLTVKVFVDACPEHVVEEHRDALQRGESLFDRDLRLTVALARDGARRLSRPTRPGARLALKESRESEDEPA
jgi:uncharacterized membrane protein YkvA (DUF1232 family)